MVGLFRKKCVFFFKKKSLFMLFIFSDAGSERELVNPCCQFGEPPHFKYFYNRVYINKLKSSQFRIFFPRKCKQKRVVTYILSCKKCLTIFFLKIKVRYIISEFFEVPQIVLGSQKSKL